MFDDKEAFEVVSAIARTGSFTRAALELDKHQSGVSGTLAKLEKRLGVRLFDRSRRPVALTEEGRVWLDYGTRMEALANERERYFEDLKGLARGSVRVGCNPCRTKMVVLPALKRFCAAHPGVKVELEDVRSADAQKIFASHRLDLALTLEPFVESDFEMRPVCDERVFLAVPATHPLARSGSRPNGPADPVAKADFAQFVDEDFVLLDHGVKFNGAYYELCRRYGRAPQVVVESSSMTTIGDLVTQGLGCAFVPDGVAYCSPKDAGAPVFFDLSDACACHRVVAVWPKERYLSRAAQAFVDLLCEGCK